jgi:hypothetical protein
MDEFKCMVYTMRVMYNRHFVTAGQCGIRLPFSLLLFPREDLPTLYNACIYAVESFEALTRDKYTPTLQLTHIQQSLHRNASLCEVFSYRWKRRILQSLGSLTLVYELVFRGGGLICYINCEIKAIIHLSVSPLYFRNGPFRDSANIRC